MSILKPKKANFSQNMQYVNVLLLKNFFIYFYTFLLCILAFSFISYNSSINT